MITTDAKLGDWDEPVKRILAHFHFNGSRKDKIVNNIANIKKFYDQTGVAISSMNKILEISSDNKSTMSEAAKVLGFRGEYRVCRANNVGRLNEEYDLCILPLKVYGELSKTIKSKYFLRAFDNGKNR